MGLVAVTACRAGLAGMPGLQVDGGDDPIPCDPPGDPPAPWPLARLNVLAGHQRQQRDRLGLGGVKLDIGQDAEHGQRGIDQPRHQRLGSLWVIPGTHRLARPVIVMALKLDLARLRDEPTDPADRRDQLGDGVLGRDRILQVVESSTRRPRPLSTPVASTTCRTASKIRRGLDEVRMRLRQYTSTVGWKPSSSRRSPQATFQAMSRRNALTASRSDRPSRACSTITVAITSAGTEGWPPPWRVRSANSSGGNSWWRWSTRKAYTDPSGTRCRHQVAASSWSSEAWRWGRMPGSLPRQRQQHEQHD